MPRPIYPAGTRFEYASHHYKGVIQYTCVDCPFTAYRSESIMEQHCRRTGHGVVSGMRSEEQFIQDEAPLPPRDVIITLGYLCWNTRQASTEGAIALVAEMSRLYRLGCAAHVVILDNGSTDGTVESIVKEVGCRSFVEIIRYVRNFGISAGRNGIVDAALHNRSDYLFMLDGDAQVVPMSVYTMAKYLECHRSLGCIGPASSGCTPDSRTAAKALHEIPESRVKKDVRIAWTQYGLFRCTMFQMGVRFDESGPFGEPGWGYEDDDLYLQMIQHGWDSRYFGGMTYLHRIRSSWPNLKAEGVNVQAMFKKRKDYLLDKWRRKGVEGGILQRIEAQQCPKEAA